MSTEDILNSWTVKELKNELKRRKLTTQGLKANLINRLKDDLVNDPQINKVHLESHSTTSMCDEGTHSNGRLNHQYSHEELKELRHHERLNRQKIVLWRKPILTIQYFILELFDVIRREKRNVLKHKKTCSSIVLISSVLFILYMLEGSHQQYISVFKKDILWCLYWIGLGVLSSVGLGTGLHTFILYLGPHIAKVTLAAWECGSLEFPEPPYPNEILCPKENSQSIVNMFTIMSKIRLEAVMWGAGTAIGELPPYFMARAARLSGEEDPDNEELEELEELISSESTDLFTRAKKAVPKIVERVGFFGILLFASIPNPLFDLAGITCGHCLVPFWTFFGATLIGKAIIKMHLQQTFVILCFSKSYVETVLNLLGEIPYIGPYVQSPFQKAVQAQKNKLHQVGGVAAEAQGTNILGFIFEKLVTGMIIYFVVSIINSMAQSYAKKIDELQRRMLSTKPEKKE